MATAVEGVTIDFIFLSTLLILLHFAVGGTLKQRPTQFAGLKNFPKVLWRDQSCHTGADKWNIGTRHSQRYKQLPQESNRRKETSNVAAKPKGG